MKFYPRYYYQKPHCRWLANSRTLFLLRHKDDTDFTRIKYLDVGCGLRRLCLDCGKRYTQAKSSDAQNLFSAIINRYPETKVVHLVLTIPHNHPYHMKAGSASFSQLLRSANRFVKLHYPGAASLNVLHNWSSSNPEALHIHVHCLIVCLDKYGQPVDHYVNAEHLRESWRQLIFHPVLPVVHVEYFGLSDLAAIMHKLNYNLRSPIVDYCKNGDKPLSVAYCKTVALLDGVHTIRWTGWLANCCRHRNLSNLGIDVIVHNPLPEWRLFSILQADWDYHSGKILLSNGDEISPDDVFSIDQILRSKSYVIRR